MSAPVAGRRRGWPGSASIGQRLAGGLLLLVGVLVLNLVAAVPQLTAMQAANNQLRHRDLPLQASTDGLFNHLLGAQTALGETLVTGDASSLAAVHHNLAAATADEATLAGLTRRDRALVLALTQVRQRARTWERAYLAPQLRARATTPLAGLLAALPQGDRLFHRIDTAAGQLKRAASAQVAADLSQAASAQLEIFILVLLTSVIGCVVAGTLIVLTARSVLRPLAALGQMARDLGDDRPIRLEPPRGTPELRELHANLTTAGLHLQEKQARLSDSNAELARAVQVKSEFLATMSHELRTPLNVILGFAELIRTGAAGVIPETAQDHLDRVIRNGRILLGLISDILDLSRLEAGRMEVGCAVTAVDVIVRQVVEDARSVADRKSLVLTLHPSLEPAAALADPRALTQVLTNLVGNAVKFTEAGGVTVELRTTTTTIQVAVADTGPGIPEADRESIFDAFRRGTARIHDELGSTGLGLAISRRLATLMSGRIEVESQVGFGSRFTIQMPLARVSAGLRAGRQEHPLVLGVAQDPEALGRWEVQATAAGFDFAGTTDGPTGLRAAAALRPAVVLLLADLDREGAEHLLDQLREQPDTRELAVLLVTSGAAPAAAGAAGADGFLRRPVPEQALRPALLQHRRSRDTARAAS
ncbi:MAG TPA: HAMP domain-containing sensor histidine kinase [Candidatus Micrarchaeia archaeon]|nr:HAMP domain-containing sensor histidine kinase [Candidatus Micrarchaeia archaeon]